MIHAITYFSKILERGKRQIEAAAEAAVKLNFIMNLQIISSFQTPSYRFLDQLYITKVI